MIKVHGSKIEYKQKTRSLKISMEIELPLEDSILNNKQLEHFERLIERHTRIFGIPTREVLNVYIERAKSM